MFRKLLSGIMAFALALACSGAVALADEPTVDPAAAVDALTGADPAALTDEPTVDPAAPTDALSGADPAALADEPTVDPAAPTDALTGADSAAPAEQAERYTPYVADVCMGAGATVTVDVIDLAHEGARLPEQVKLQSVEITNRDLSGAVSMDYASDTGKLTITTTAEFDADTECVLQFCSADADADTVPSHKYDAATFKITCDAALSSAADAVVFDRIKWIENYGTTMTLPNGTSNCVLVFYATNENGDIIQPPSHSLSFVYESTYYFNARVDDYYIYHDDGSYDKAFGLYIDTIADTGGRYFHISLTAFPNYSDTHESRGLDIAVTNSGATDDSISDVYLKPGESVTIALDGILSNDVTWADSYASSQPELLDAMLDFDYDAQSRTLTITASPDFEETIDVTLRFFNNTTGKLDVEYEFDVICAGSEALPTEPAPTEPVPTEPAQTRTGVVVNVPSSLNIRPAASMDSQPITTVKNGTVLTILGEQGDFYRVQLADGTTGYASREYVRETTGEPVPTEPAPTEPAPTEPAPTEPASDRRGVVVNVRTSLNIRPSADTTGRPLTTVKNGTELMILGEQGGFYRVQLADGTIGYASMDYVNELASIDPDEYDYFVEVTTNGGKLNLRRTPGGTRMALIPNGTRLVIVDVVGDWSLVEYNGLRGYVSNAYIKNILFDA